MEYEHKRVSSSSPDLTIADTPVFVAQDPAGLHALIRKRKLTGKVHLICDTETVRVCLPRIPAIRELSCDPIVIGSGEQHKTLATCEFVWSELIRQGADRDSFVINLGGGVVTDLGGFCAATFQRGIPFMHLPTSLLAMCDAALGGKHGVDFSGLKNYLGLFVQPELIWIDPSFLTTLPPRHLVNGMAEVVKHAIIGSPELFHVLEELSSMPDPQSTEMHDLIRAAIAVKKKFVDGDVRDHGARAALNFGHTIGHALESHFLHAPEPLLHGEAIAHGMIAETWLSHFLLGAPDRPVCRRVTSLIRKYVPTDLPDPVDLDALIPLIARDKKGKQDQIRMSLIRDVGTPECGVPVTTRNLSLLRDDPEIGKVLSWLGNTQKTQGG